jgi:hypothetical protein
MIAFCVYFAVVLLQIVDCREIEGGINAPAARRFTACQELGASLTAAPLRIDPREVRRLSRLTDALTMIARRQIREMNGSC